MAVPPKSSAEILAGLNWGMPMAPQPQQTSLSPEGLAALAGSTPPVQDQGAATRHQERLQDASDRRRALLAGDTAALEREAFAQREQTAQTDLSGLSQEDQFRIAAQVNREGWDAALANSRERGLLQTGSDAVVGAVGGAVGGAMGLATAAAIPFSDRAAIGIAQAGDGVRDWFESGKSDELQEAKRQVSLRNAVNAEQSALQKEEDIRNGDSDLWAGTKQIGRDVLSAASNIGSDGAVLGDIASEFAGNLASSAGIGGLVAKGVARGLSQQASTKLAEKLAVGGVTGAMEGGDAFSNAALNIMDMSPEELMQKSPNYRDFLAQGMSHEDAQIELAADAGKIAAALTVPVAAAAGAAVSRFELNPLSGGLLSAPVNAVTQGAEETLQEGWVQAAGNIAQRWSGANPEQDIAEGVGEAAATGLLGGVMMGGGAGGLRTAASVPRAGAQAVASLGRGLGSMADRRLQREEEEAQEVAPASPAVARMRDSGAKASQSLEEMKAELAQLKGEPVTEMPTKPLVDEEGVVDLVPAVEPVATEEDGPASLQEAALYLQQSLNTDQGRVALLPERVREVVGQQASVDSLQNAVELLEGENDLSEEEQTRLGLYLKVNIGDLNNSIQEAAKLSQKFPELAEATETYQGMLAELLSNPVVAKYQETKFEPEQIRSMYEGMDLNDPTTAATTVVLAEQEPSSVPRQAIQAALDHAKAGKIKLTPRQQEFLELSNQLHDAIEGWAKKVGAEYNPESGLSQTRNQILLHGNENSGSKSMLQYVDTIVAATRAGNRETVDAELRLFDSFVRGQQNKLKALEASKENGGEATPYARYAGGKWHEAHEAGAGSIAYSSPRFLTAVQAETAALDRGYKALNKALGVLRTPTPQAAPVAEVRRPEPSPMARELGISSMGELDILLQEQEADEAAEAEREIAQREAARAYKPRKTTVLPANKKNPLVEKIQEARTENNTVPRANFTREELKEMRDELGMDTTQQNITVPQEIEPVAETLVQEEAEVQEETLIDEVEEDSAVLDDEEQEIVTEPVEEKPVPTVAELLPTVRDTVLNGYTVRPRDTYLLQQTNPLNFLFGKIKEEYRPSGKVAGAWKFMLDTLAPTNMEARLNDRKKSVLKLIEEGTKTQQGKNYWETRDNLMLGFVSKKGDDTYGYDPKTVSVLRAATLHFILNDFEVDPKSLDESSATAAFQLDSQSPYVREALDYMRTAGINGTVAVDTLARHFEQLLGISPKNDVTKTFSEGPTRAMAAEMLASLIEKGTLVERRRWFPEGVQYRTLQLNPNLREQIWEARKTLREAGQSDAVMEVMNPEHEAEAYVNAPPPKETLARTQMRNRMTSLTRKEQKAIANEEAKGSVLNLPLLNIMRSIGEAAWIKMMGYQDIDPDQAMNAEHKLTVEGKNTSIRNGYQKTMQLYSKALTKSGDMDPKEIRIYNRWGVSKVGRLQELGFGGQGDKQAREAFPKTFAKVDMGLKENQDKFWLSIAQSIGIKTEQKSRAQSVREAKALMESEANFPIMQELYAWVEETNDSGQPATLSADAVERIVEMVTRLGENKAEVTDPDGEAYEVDMGGANAKVFHALLSVAQFQYAEQNGTLQDFEHMLAVEADGKTDGPINAFMNYASGMFNSAQFHIMRMGGIFLNQKDQSYNSWFAKNRVDLYEHTANILKDRIDNFFASESMPPAEKELMRSALELATLTGEVIKGKEYRFKRNAIKNPLTVFVYGSSIRGIAGKVVKGIMDGVYKDASGVLNGSISADAFQDKLDKINELLSYKMVQDGTEKVFEKDDSLEIPKRVTYEKFKLSPEQHARLVDNITESYGARLEGAILESMFPAKETMKKFQSATQIQSVFIKSAFNRRVQEELAKRTGTETGLALSEKEYLAILKEVSPLGATVRMVDQTAAITSTEASSDVSDDSDVRSAAYEGPIVKGKRTNGYLGTKFRNPAPASAGVKAAPFMTIMTGDGLMILNLAADGLADSLMVFDGVELSIANVDEQSKLINKATVTGWLEDSSEAVVNSFEETMTAAVTKKTFAALGYQERLDIIRSAGNLDVAFNQLAADFKANHGKLIRDLVKTKDNKEAHDALLKRMDKAIQSSFISDAGVVYSLNHAYRQLVNVSDQIRARKAVTKSLTFSSDHMATAEQPYTHEGVELVVQNGKVIPLSEAKDEDGVAMPPSDEELAVFMNTRFEEELRKIKKERGEWINPVPDDKGIIAAVKATKRKKSDGPVSLTASQLFHALRGHVPNNSHQRKMFHSLLKFLKGSGTRFHFGSLQELNQRKLATNASPEQVMTEDTYGQYDPQTNQVFIAKGTTETLLHEMVHVVSAKHVFDALVQPENSTKEKVDAVGRLVKLKNDFLNLPINSAAFYGSEFADNWHALLELDQDKTPVGQAKAVNEFMAMVMSNPAMIHVARTRQARTGLSRIIYKGMVALKSLLNMREIPDNIFHQTVFNMDILMRPDGDGPPTGSGMDALNHGSNARQDIHSLADRMRTKVSNFAAKASLLDKTPSIKQGEARKVLANLLAYFPMNDQEQAAFLLTHLTTNAVSEVDKGSELRARELYRATMQALQPSDLQDIKGSQDPAQVALGESRYKALRGDFLASSDRRNMFGAFMALAQIFPPLTETLEAMPLPKSRKVTGSESTFDDWVRSTTNRIGEGIASRTFDRENRGANVGSVLAGLLEDMTTLDEESVSRAERAYTGFMDNMENKAATLVQKSANKATRELGRLARNQENKLAKLFLGGAALVTSTLSPKYASEYGVGVVSSLNTSDNWRTTKELVFEFMSTTRDNEFVHDLVGKVKYAIDALRDTYTKTLPAQIMDQFKSKMDAQTWTQLNNVLINTDLGSLARTVPLEEVKALIKDQATLAKKIRELEGELSSYGRGVQKIQKAEALARYLGKGEVTSKNLLKNSYAIAKLYGERHATNLEPSKAELDLIDNLVSLKTLAHVDKGDRQRVAELFEQDAPAIGFVLNLMDSFGKRELKKMNLTARINHIKGKIPALRGSTGKVVLADRAEHQSLIRQGYIFKGAYEGETDLSEGGLGYYFHPVGNQTTYNQGVLQTVHTSFFGVDPVNGYTIDGMGTREVGKQARISHHNLMSYSRKVDGLDAGEYAVPVYDEDGVVRALEFPIRPDMATMAPLDNHLAARIGAWRGRQAEEHFGLIYNENLIKLLGKNYREADSRTNEYINIAGSSDPIHQHIWKIIPAETKEVIAREFPVGEDARGKPNPPEFWVRRDLVNNALGFPSASMTEVFTNRNRLPKEVNKAISDALITVFGSKAFEYVKRAEGVTADVVALAKNTIVIRSIVVPVTNMIANAFHLLMRGVSLRSFGRPLKTKVSEINTFIRNRQRQAELDAQMAGFGHNPEMHRRMMAEYRAIDEENQRMSIWPLIRRGEFSSITDGLSEAERTLEGTRLGDWVEAKIEQLHPSIRTTAKWAVVSKDTALYQGLNRSVQYGDFVAKALLYDHLMEKGKSEEEAYRTVRNEFVNYNLLGGRVRSAMESLGFAWFYNFKIRSTKVAVAVARENPLSALLWAISPTRDIPIWGFSDGVFTDSILPKAIEGGLGHTLGHGMATHVFESNPLVRLSS